MAPRMPNGTELMDIAKGTWKLGDAIGSGGFGLIYLSELVIQRLWKAFCISAVMFPHCTIFLNFYVLFLVKFYIYFGVFSSKVSPFRTSIK